MFRINVRVMVKLIVRVRVMVRVIVRVRVRVRIMARVAVCHYYQYISCIVLATVAQGQLRRESKPQLGFQSILQL